MDYDEDGDGDVDSEDVGPAPKISVTAYAEDSEAPLPQNPQPSHLPLQEREPRGNVGMASDSQPVAQGETSRPRSARSDQSLGPLLEVSAADEAAESVKCDGRLDTSGEPSHAQGGADAKTASPLPAGPSTARDSAESVPVTPPAPQPQPGRSRMPPSLSGSPLSFRTPTSPFPAMSHNQSS